MTQPSSSTSGQLTKAKIINKKDNTTITCMFNPEQFKFTKQNSWNFKSLKDRDVPEAEFSGGGAVTFSLTLFFDTYLQHSDSGPAAGSDVRALTKPLWDLMKIDSSVIPVKPPNCVFQWGKIKFEAVITSLDETFTLFLANGTPVRSEINISFTQIKDDSEYPAQNPTSGGSPGEHVRIIREGETLSGIAYEEYGNPAAWRHLANINRIRDPRHLQPGQTLLITPLP